jgi:4a-hydroxytetrahydrobiopterin dehydratase
MTVQTLKEPVHKHCSPCERNLATVKMVAVEAQLEKVPGWRITHAGKRIRKDWVVKNFTAGLEFFDCVDQLAEEEGHYPDLHIEGFRNVWIELSTHAIGGLSDNTFILAARIDKLPFKRKTTEIHDAPGSNALTASNGMATHTTSLGSLTIGSVTANKQKGTSDTVHQAAIDFVLVTVDNWTSD